MGVERENWPATVGLVTGLFAKEAIVGTMTGLYGQMAAAEAAAAEGGEVEEERFAFGAAIVEALASVPEGLAGVFGALGDPLGTSIVAEDDGSIAGEIGAETTTFGQLRASFGNDWTRAFAYLLFVLIYFPCLAAFGAIVREIGPKFGWLAMVYLTVLAWSVATLFFQIATGHNAFFIILAVALVALFIPVFNLMSGRRGEFGKHKNPFEASKPS
jgi:ferrous iron transport protein B